MSWVGCCLSCATVSVSPSNGGGFGGTGYEENTERDNLDGERSRSLCPCASSNQLDARLHFVGSWRLESTTGWDGWISRSEVAGGFACGFMGANAGFTIPSGQLSANRLRGAAVPGFHWGLICTALHCAWLSSSSRRGKTRIPHRGRVQTKLKLTMGCSRWGWRP